MLKKCSIEVCGGLFAYFCFGLFILGYFRNALLGSFAYKQVIECHIWYEIEISWILDIPADLKHFANEAISTLPGEKSILILQKRQRWMKIVGCAASHTELSRFSFGTVLL